MFLDDLPADEQAALARQRADRLEALIASYEAAPKHEYGVGVDLAIDQQLHLLRAEREWLTTTLLPALITQVDQSS